jgi:hypothetical protein
VSIDMLCLTPQDSALLLAPGIVWPSCPPRRGFARQTCRHPQAIISKCAELPAIEGDGVLTLAANAGSGRAARAQLPIGQTRHEKPKLGFAETGPARLTPQQRVVNADDTRRTPSMRHNVKMTGPQPSAAKPPPAGLGPCRLTCYPSRLQPVAKVAPHICNRHVVSGEPRA